MPDVDCNPFYFADSVRTCADSPVVEDDERDRLTSPTRSESIVTKICSRIKAFYCIVPFTLNAGSYVNAAAVFLRFTLVIVNASNVSRSWSALEVLTSLLGLADFNCETALPCWSSCF